MPHTEPLHVRRALTETPLARQHERLLSKGDSRRRPEPPWSEFDPKAYPQAALALAHDFQRSLALGEYVAVDLFARLASALALNGAPFDLVAAASRILADEIRHADYCIRFASLCSGHDVVIEVERRRTGPLASAHPTLAGIDIVMLEVAAVGETLAAALLSGCRDRATDPLARTLFTSIVGDEVHHARLGWYYFAWRAPQWTRAERQRIADFAGRLLLGLEPQFWKGRDAPARSRSAAAALGVLDSVTQRRIVRRVLGDEIVPALDALGLGASHAWRIRRRGGP